MHVLKPAVFPNNRQVKKDAPGASFRFVCTDRFAASDATGTMSSSQVTSLVSLAIKDHKSKFAFQLASNNRGARIL